jgi:TetR/AcrR family transcriptional regulator, regulator of cefoperazone and chloramphenicol sensitivity
MGDDTRERVMEAAGELFAERGFRGATMRAIAERAATNLASAHYHFGSKEKLYLDVAFAMFSALQGKLAERGLSPTAGELAQRARPELEELLRARIETMVESLLDAPGLHSAMMLRELADPTPALKEIVGRFMDPVRKDFEVIVRHLEPALSPEAAEWCVRSIAGQIFFYRTHRPALLIMMSRKSYARDFPKQVADHVLAFTLGGIARIAATDREATCAAGS